MLAHAALDLGAHRALVARVVQPAGLVFAAGMADFHGLRERADGGGREARQAQLRRLLGRALAVGTFALAQVAADLGNGGLHHGVVHAGRLGARRQRGLVGGQLGGHGGAAFVDGACQQVQLIELLAGKGQPGPHLRVQALLAGQIDRHMQQRARRRQPQALAQSRGQRLHPVQHGVQVGFPDVAAVDDAQRQHLVLRQQVDQRQHVVAAVDGVHMHAGHGQVGRQVGVVLQLAEVGGQQQLYAAGLELVISQVEGVAPVLIQLGHQNRLVDLHPFGARIGQRVQQLGVNGQQAVEQGQLVGIVLGLAQRQVSHRADHHRLGLHAERLGLGQLRQQARCVQLELGVGREFGDDVVVVGVEPLGHLARGHAVRAAAAGRFAGGGGAPARHAEVVVQRVAVKALHALGQVAQGKAGVQHLVIERKVAHRHPVQRGLVGPVARAQGLAGAQQLVAGALVLPVRLEGEFQFTARADARVA